MALADYYERAAVAAAEVIAGFDEVAFRERLASTRVGISFGTAAGRSIEGRNLLDLLVRLVARLYPSLAITASGEDDDYGAALAQLAGCINPRIDLSAEMQGVDALIVVGPSRRRPSNAIYVGSTGWDAFVSTHAPQPLGRSTVPFGAGAAATMAAAILFRRLVAGSAPAHEVSHLSTFAKVGHAAEAGDGRAKMSGDAVLVGAGAIGNGALWALSRTDLEGTLHIVDGEAIDLGNLQRYVLANRADEGAAKVAVATRDWPGPLRAEIHPEEWREVAGSLNETSAYALLGLDSARDRRLVQASLPRWIANGWTQPGGDLGISVHPKFGAEGACVACLYLPDGAAPNEDELVAQALRLTDRVPDVRTLLHTGSGLTGEILSLIAERLERPVEVLQAYEGRHIRDLYVEGVCGGAVLPLSRRGQPPADVHVPLAHQSALAGVLLAAALTRAALGLGPSSTELTHVDVMRPLAPELTGPARRRADGRCLCDDDDYVGRYAEKWS